MSKYIMEVPIQLYFFVIVYPVLLFLTGRFLSQVLHMEGNLFHYIYRGFFYSLALFQIVWLFTWKVFDSFSVLKLLYGGIFFLSAIGGIYFLFSRDGLEQYRVFFKKVFVKKNVWILMLVGLYVANTFFLQFLGTDDSYYLPKAGMIIRYGMLNPTFTEAGNGLNETSTFTRADISSWPAYLAYWADLFKVNPTVLAHTVFGVVLIVVGACVTVSVACRICKGSKQRFWFILIYYLLGLWNVCGHDQWGEYWIVQYPWYGVAVLNILLYCLLDSILFLYQQMDEYVYRISYWIYNLIIVLACIQCEIVGIILAPCFVFVYGLPYLIKIGWKKTKRLIPYLMVLFVPIVICAISILYQIISKKIPKGMLGLATEISWLSWVKSFLVVNPIAILWIISFIYIAWKGNKINRYTLFGGCMVLWLTFLNPLFYRFVCGYITSNTVYYRIYWCIPLLYMVSYMLSDLFLRINKKNWYFIFVCGILFFLCQIPKGTLLKRAMIASNKYKLNEDMIAAADYMISGSASEKVRVIANDQLAHYLRQYSVDILYPCSMRSSGEIIEGTTYSHNSFYWEIYNHTIDEKSEFLEILNKLETDYIVYSQEEDIPGAVQRLPIKEIGNYKIVSIN